jgi:hypothetical protein
MTRGELRNLVLYWLDDLDAGYFTPTQVNLWLNNAQMEVQKQLLQCGEYWYLKCVFADTVQNQDCYSLPADFLKCHRFELRVQGTSAPNEVWTTLVDQTLQEAAMFNYGAAQPGVYTIGKDCFYLRPIPDSGYRIKLHYSYRVDPMVDDLNVPDVPDQYQEYIAVLAAIDGFLKDERDPTPMYAKRDYYQDMMKKDQIQRNRAQPRRIIRTSDDGIMGY